VTSTALERDSRAVLVVGPDDDRFLKEAFALAERGRGRTHPNPLVGALLVRDGEVVGRGWHEGPGRPHAEAVALAEADERAHGATLYCTLEPCAHHGRTPPCAEALVRAGVRRAVVALQDPNPLVDGRGLARLRAAGVAVELAGEGWARRARRQNAAFVKWHERGLPLVTYKAAVSLDGKVAAAGGDARWVSGEESRRLAHELRAATDAVMVGAGTVRRDDPQLTVRLAAGRDPVRVVVTTRGELPAAARVLRTPPPTLVLAPAVDAATAARLGEGGAEVVAYGDGGLAAALRALGERGLLDVLCEGGPTLAAALLAEGLVDRVTVFVAPLLVGRGAPDLLAAPAVARLADGLRLREVEWRQVGDDLMVSGWLGDGAAWPIREEDRCSRAS